ncbi:hypothetical protein HDU76_005154 [Blyttiomyces sp. JEL0837]|nr:hypothetical protein HDU76_005154 [Blyttiomyces sp. JEL0837]
MPRRDDRSRSPDRRRRSRSRDRDSRRSRRSRSASPRRPVVPLHLRPRKLANWDLPPPGYENMTVDQVKATGFFPLPGQAPKAHAFSMGALYGGADYLQRVMPSAMPIQPAAAAAAVPATGSSLVARQSRRLYVGSIPYGVTEEALISFFGETMSQLNLATSSQPPVVSAQINHDKNYAFVEFRTPEECTAAMALDGLPYSGQTLKIRRPKDYQQTAGPVPTAVLPGVVSTNVPDSPYKLFVGGLPSYLNDDQVMELLKSFGDLRAFNLVKDSSTGLSKGYAFCEYLNPAITEIACQGLNGMELGDKKLVVQRASIGSNKQAAAAPSFLPSMLPSSLLGMTAGNIEPTTVLLLLNMVTAEELEDDEEYSEILDDITEECSKYGRVINVVIPRGLDNPNVGKIFVEYSAVEGATAALKALAGRKIRLTKWFTSDWSTKEKNKTVKEVSQTVLSRRTKMCNVLEYKDYKVVYRRYASLFFIAGIDSDDNELLTLEVIHRYVEVLDKWFLNVCELDIIFNFQQAYTIMGMYRLLLMNPRNELLIGGELQESSKRAAINTLKRMEETEKAELSSL